MANNKRISDEERKSIIVLRETRMSCREIASRVNRGFASVSRILNFGVNFGKVLVDHLFCRNEINPTFCGKP